MLAWADECLSKPHRLLELIEYRIEQDDVGMAVGAEQSRFRQVDPVDRQPVEIESTALAIR